MYYVSFDIDGTLVDSTDRLMRCIKGGSVDWGCFLDCGKLHLDRANRPMVELANYLGDRGYGIIILTGRPEYMRGCTLRQLHEIGLRHLEEVFMRPNNNHEPDPDYKSWMMAKIMRRYRVIAHFEDNWDTIRALRALGVECVAASPPANMA